MARDVVFGAMFGAGRMMDAYLAAFQIPNLLRDMFAEGALSQAFTSTFTKLWEKEGAASAWQLTQLILSTILLVLGLITTTGIVTSYWLVVVLNPGFTEDPLKVEITTQLTQILWPFILFTSLAAIVMGALNSRGYFGLPASASSVFNLVSVLLGVGLAYVIDPQPDWTQLPKFGPNGIYAVAIGTLIGGLAQLVVQLPLFWKIGYRFRWHIDFRDPRFIMVLSLMGPTVLAAMAVQINVIINGIFLSHIEGGRTWYQYAFRLFQFPVGVFGVAVATVILPAVARFKAADDSKGFGRAVEDALRFAFYLTLPASFGLAVLAPQIVRMVYQYGHFDADDARMTAYSLQAFSIGIAGYSGIKVLIPCFIALNQPNTPFKVSCIAIVINGIMASSFFLLTGLGHIGLSLTVSFVIIINFLQLLWYLQGQVPLGRASRWAAFFGKVALAASALASVGYGIGLIADQMTSRLLFTLMTLLAVASAGIAFFGVSWVLQLSESVELLDMLKRKLGLSSPNRKRERSP